MLKPDSKPDVKPTCMGYAQINAIATPAGIGKAYPIRMTIFEAALVVLGIEPDLCPSLTPEQRLQHERIMQAAIAALGKPKGLPTNWQWRACFAPGSDYRMVMVSTVDFLDWARRSEHSDSDVPLTRRAIVDRYTRIDPDPRERYLKWRHWFARNLEVKACLSPDAKPGKPLYSREKIERWLIKRGLYTEDELQARSKRLK